MAANIEQELIEKVRALPPDRQLEALRLLDKLVVESDAEAREPERERKPLWKVAETNAQLPDDTWDRVPTDG